MLKNTPVAQKLRYLKVFPATALNVNNTKLEGKRDTATDALEEAVHVGTP
jgi:hypothetical protein